MKWGLTLMPQGNIGRSRWVASGRDNSVEESLGNRGKSFSEDQLYPACDAANSSGRFVGFELVAPPWRVRFRFSADTIAHTAPV